MGNLLRDISRLWSYDWGLSVLMVALVVTCFVLPPLSDEIPWSGQLADAFFVLALFSGLRVVLGKPALASAVGALALFNVVVKSVFRGGAGPSWALADASLSLVSLLLLVWVVATQLPTRGPISRHHIQGAIALYLLLGLVWSQAYRLLDLVNPAAFELPLPFEAQDERGRAFLYLSLITLTTVGYGDVTPISEAARSLATAEGLMGQLFPAILLARLVSLQAVDDPVNPPPPGGIQDEGGGPADAGHRPAGATEGDSGG